jgi:hypothetical protein
MRIIIISLILLLATVLEGFAQNRGNIWAFGDSAGINFNIPNNPVPITTGLRTRGSCVSICDTTGQLLFYANTRAAMAGNTTLVYNQLNQVMVNGDNIQGEGWYHELVIVPFPNDDDKFYLFSIGVTGSSSNGLNYSIIDMSLNNGLGEVIQKNIQLQSFDMVDCLSAVKHGNGRDWWLLFRKFDGQGSSNSLFYQYLISPSGISSVILQSVGSQNSTNIGNIKFNKSANTFCYSNYAGLLELYDFDRCTGIISNPVTILPQNISAPWPALWGTEFSENGDILYVSAPRDTAFLFQFDLSSPNISASVVTLWTNSFPFDAAGSLKRGKDGKIYFTHGYNNGLQFPYPYVDTVYNMYNMNLGVINYPDSLGSASDFQPYSFNLGGRRTYWGLPNNPDYDMGPIVGSICDTIVSVTELPEHATGLSVYFNKGWEKMFVNAQNLKGHTYRLHIYDLMGHLVFIDEGKLNSPYFTKDVYLPGIASGLYVVRLETDKETVAKKVVVR